jgi:hypothetical protein
MTIEHLAAQNAFGPNPISDERCAEIGNLILLDHELNEKLGNEPFPEKLKIIQNSIMQLESAITKAQKWSDTEISKRTERLATLAYNKVWHL